MAGETDVHRKARQDAEMTAAHERDEARKVAREAEPLRRFCVKLKSLPKPLHVAAHRVLGGDDPVYFSFITLKPVEWTRFVVWRYGREDVVARFRNEDVQAVYEIDAEPIE